MRPLVSRQWWDVKTAQRPVFKVRCFSLGLQHYSSKWVTDTSLDLCAYSEEHNTSQETVSFMVRRYKESGHMCLDSR